MTIEYPFARFGITLGFLFAAAVLFACSARTTQSPGISMGKDRGATSVAWSPDGSRLAVANYRRIWIFDAEGLKPLRTLYAGKKFDSGYRYHYRYGSDNTLVFLSGRLIATTGMGAMVTVWDVVTGSRIDAIDWPPAEHGYPASLAYDASTDTLAAGTGLGTVMMATRRSGQPLAKLEGHAGVVLALQFDSDSRHLAAAGPWPEIVVWDVQTSMEATRIPLDGMTWDLSRLGQGFLIAGKELRVWNAMTARDESAPDNPETYGPAEVLSAVAVGTAATAGATALLAVGETALYGVPFFANPASAALVPVYFIPVPGTLDVPCKRSVATTADGRLVADMYRHYSDGRIRVIETTTAQIVHEVRPRGSETCSLVFSPDGRRLLIANEKGGHVYDLESRETTSLDMRYEKPR